MDTDERGLVPRADHDQVARISRGFPVGMNDHVPAIGETGVSQQFFCPLLKATCIKDKCMFWVELLTHDAPDALRVGHCAYYWNALQLVEVKQALIRLNALLEKGHAPA